MPRSEREDLQRLVRQRERVLKSAAKQRTADLIADFENQMGQEYSFDQDEIWAKAQAGAAREIEKAKKLIAARCRALGIPDRFAPTIEIYWRARGYDNSVQKRRIELRRMAQTRVEAIERKAITEIELSCLKASEQIAIAGLSSDAARQFIESLPSIDQLMPQLSFAEVAGESELPIAEQLVDSNALRQRRYRERQAALRSNASKALPAPSRNGPDDDGELP